MYHTGAVTSPKSPRNVDVRLDTADDLDDIKNNSIKVEDQKSRTKTGQSMSLTLKGNLWNNSKKKQTRFDEEKPSAASTNADEEDGLKYRQPTKRTKQTIKKSRLNKKTLDTFSASQQSTARDQGGDAQV